MRNFDIKFRGVDDFNRPVFKVVDKAIYFGSTNILAPDKDRFPKGTKEEIYGKRLGIAWLMRKVFSAT